jgi:hypothetical protein
VYEDQTWNRWLGEGHQLAMEIRVTVVGIELPAITIPKIFAVSGINPD